MLNTVEEGLEDIRQGKVLIVVDDEDRENEGDFIVSGEKITPEIVNFMITHGRGLLCALCHVHVVKNFVWLRWQKKTLHC